MLTPNEMQRIMDNYTKAQNNYQNELIRVMAEVETEFKKINYSGDDQRPVKQIINDLLEKKKKTDKNYIDAERTLQNAQKEFMSMSTKF